MANNSYPTSPKIQASHPVPEIKVQLQVLSPDKLTQLLFKYVQSFVNLTGYI